jgi:hypothetical protein
MIQLLKKKKMKDNWPHTLVSIKSCLHISGGILCIAQRHGGRDQVISIALHNSLANLKERIY